MQRKGTIQRVRAEPALTTADQAVSIVFSLCNFRLGLSYWAFVLIEEASGSATTVSGHVELSPLPLSTISVSGVVGIDGFTVELRLLKAASVWALLRSMGNATTPSCEEIQYYASLPAKRCVVSDVSLEATKLQYVAFRGCSLIAGAQYNVAMCIVNGTDMAVETSFSTRIPLTPTNVFAEQPHARVSANPDEPITLSFTAVVVGKTWLSVLLSSLLWW